MILRRAAKGRNHSRTPDRDLFVFRRAGLADESCIPVDMHRLMCMLPSLHGNFARHFLFAPVCGGRGDSCRSFFDSLHDTLGGDRRHCLVAGGPFQGLVVGIGGRNCDLQGRCLSSRHGQ